MIPAGRTMFSMARPVIHGMGRLPPVKAVGSHEQAYHGFVGIASWDYRVRPYAGSDMGIFNRYLLTVGCYRYVIMFVCLVESSAIV